MNTLTQSLWITIISMGLVFMSLILLALLMAAMTRIFRDREPDVNPTGALLPELDVNDRQRAAALAVAVALAEQSQSSARPLVSPEPTIIGAWQLGMRTRQMTQKGEKQRR